MISKLRALALASVMIFAPPAAARSQSADSIMRVLKVRYQRITDGAPHYQPYQAGFDSLGLEHWGASQGRLTASFEGDTLRMLVAKSVGPDGPTTRSFYFWKGAPFEIRVRLRGGTHATPATKAEAEQRFYFDRGFLVRWVDPGHTIHPVTTGAIFARGMQLMADATRLVDAARRLREGSLTPQTPAELAETMRAQLEGLMAAELSYYVKTSTYPNDVEMVGYRPDTTVRITLLNVGARGWAARVTMANLPGKSCVAYLGKPKGAPRTLADHARPSGERQIACDKP